MQTQMARRRGEGLLVDPGAHDDLVGEKWADRFAEEARQAGQQQPTTFKLGQPVVVGGVGNGNNVAETGVRCRVGVDGVAEQYEAPMIPGSSTPALLGIKTLKQRRALLDCFTGRLFLIGAGGYKLNLSPGSRELELEASHSGHWLLPCTDWEKTRKQYPTEAADSRSSSSGAGAVYVGPSSPRGAVE